MESNNEYWLSLDARLRQDFHITTGITIDRIADFQSKSRMKHFYAQAGIPCARWQMAGSIDDALGFAQRYGYPLICKPDVGVGASNTHKLHDEQELRALFAQGFSEAMILEEYVPGDCFTFDGIANSRKEVQFMTSHHLWVPSWNRSTHRTASAVIRSSTSRRRSWTSAPGHGAGLSIPAPLLPLRIFPVSRKTARDWASLAISSAWSQQLPPGGFLPDMINYANDLDIYDIWAAVMINDSVLIEPHRRRSCAFAGRRDNVRYAHSDFEISNRYHDQLKMMQRLPAALASAMGDTVSVALFDTMDEGPRILPLRLGKEGGRMNAAIFG